MKKICYKCKKNLPIKSFSKNKSKADGHQGMCKECYKKTLKIYYKEHQEHYKEQNKERRKRIKEWVKNLKKKLKCNRCNEDDYRCLQFHHTNGEEKDIIIADATRMGYSIERIKKEIKKCEVLCANCHAKEHYKE